MTETARDTHPVPHRRFRRRWTAVAVGVGVTTVVAGGVATATASSPWAPGGVKAAGPELRDIDLDLKGGALSCDESWECLRTAVADAHSSLLGPSSGTALPNTASYLFDDAGSFQLALLLHPDSAPTSTVVFLAARGSRRPVPAAAATATTVLVLGEKGLLESSASNATLTWSTGEWHYRLSTDAVQGSTTTAAQLTDLVMAEAALLKTHV